MRKYVVLVRLFVIPAFVSSDLENNAKPQPGQSVSCTIFKPSSFRIKFRNVISWKKKIAGYRSRNDT